MAKTKKMYLCTHCSIEFDFDACWCPTCETHNHSIFMIPGRNQCSRCSQGDNEYWMSIRDKVKTAWGEVCRPKPRVESKEKPARRARKKKEIEGGQDEFAN